SRAGEYGVRSFGSFVPIVPPLEGFVCELVLPDELRDFFEVCDELLFFRRVVLRVDGARRISCKMPLGVSIHKYNPTADPFREERSRKVVLHPHGSSSADDIKPRILDGDLARILRCVIERPFLSVPNVCKKANQSFVVRS